MSITSGQVPVTSGGTVLCQLAPGPSSVVFSNGGTGVVYFGFGGTSVTTTNGMPLPSGGIMPFSTLAGDPGWTVRAVTPAGTSVAGFLISTSYGLPQPGIY